jgi:hypothetical protein
MIPVIVSVGLVITIAFIIAMIGRKISQIQQELSQYSVENLSTYSFQTGDLLLFSSSMKKWLQAVDMTHMLLSGSPITHVGVAIQDPFTGLWRCWELGLGGGIPEMFRLTNLHARIQTYKGTVLVRRLRHDSNVLRIDRHHLYAHIAKVLENQKHHPKKYRGASFYMNTYDRFLSAHPPLPLATSIQTSSSWTCTDLVNETYKAMHVFKSVDNTMWPCDFSSKRNKMPLAPGWSFSKEIRLNKDIKI